MNIAAYCRVSTDKSPGALRSIAMAGVRGNEDIKELTASYGDRELKIAIVNGLKGAEEIISRIRQGEHFDFVEVMACHGGCVSGAGQPYIVNEGKERRGKALYASDKMCAIKRSESNPLMDELYRGVLKGKVHQLLHVHYGAK